MRPRRYEEAIEALATVAANLSGSSGIFAASLAQLGRMEQAKQEASAFLVYPSFSIAHWATTQPFRREEDLQLFVDGYRKVGLPN